MDIKDFNIRNSAEGISSSIQYDALHEEGPISADVITDSFKKCNHDIMSYYDVCAQAFDNAPVQFLFDKQYSVNKQVTDKDCQELLIWLRLQRKAMKLGVSSNKDLLRGFGRFTLLFIGNDYLKSSEVFKISVIELLNSLLDCKWSYDDSIALRLTVLNAMYLLGIKSKEEAFQLLQTPLQRLKLSNDVATYDFLMESISWYLAFVNNRPNAEEIRIDWLHAYIYKVRFGFIYCRNFGRSSDKKYPILMDAYSPVLGPNVRSKVGTGAKGLFLEIGEKRRNSEYRPLESNVFYNATLGLFE